jgi:hypothetical protein
LDPQRWLRSTGDLALLHHVKGSSAAILLLDYMNFAGAALMAKFESVFQRRQTRGSSGFHLRGLPSRE